jgi:DNA-binding response OmpR family regulator
MHILLVEDDDIMGDGIKIGLMALGQTVDWVQNANSAELAVKTAFYDVVILDLGLPEMNGMELLSRWRNKNINIPVLILTAKDAIPDRIIGLQAGADDYMSKPFDLHELLARLLSIVRRSNGRPSNILSFENIEFNPLTSQVKVGGMPINLSKSELILLEALMLHSNQILSPQQLQDRLYGWTEGIESNAVAVHMHNLRKKLGNNLIETVRGLGYRLCKDRS